MGRGPPYFVLPCSFSISGGVFCRKMETGPTGDREPGIPSPNTQHTHATHNTDTRRVCSGMQYPVPSMQYEQAAQRPSGPITRLPPATCFQPVVQSTRAQASQTSQFSD